MGMEILRKKMNSSIFHIKPAMVTGYLTVRSLVVCFDNNGIAVKM
jgi:hypothetical protein